MIQLALLVMLARYSYDLCQKVLRIVRERH